MGRESFRYGSNNEGYSVNMLDGHGDDLHLAKGQIKHNFSSNVYYKGCPKPLLAELKDSLDFIENYPSPAANELSVLAGKHYHLSAEHFLFTNGATEAFYLIAQLFKGKKTAILGPTFSEYEDACRIHQLEVSIISRGELLAVDADLIWICNPNNPTGTIFSVEELTTLIHNKPQTVFVIDEAYIEFTTSTESVMQLITDHANLFVVRSLTKTFTIPGLRLGYVGAHPVLINKLLAIKMPWSVNSMAVKSGVFIFEHYEELTFDRTELIEETETFKESLKQIEWLNVLESKTSYFLVELKDKKASELKTYLVKEHQILIRDATNFNGLNGEFVRFATQEKSTNQLLINALLKWN